MSFFLFAFVSGLGLRWLLHRTGGLTALSLRAVPVVFAGLALQFAPGFPVYPDRAVLPGLVASYVLVAVWLLLNVPRQRAAYRFAFMLLAAGWLLNFIPIALNQGMPVSSWASAKADAPGIPRRGAMIKHVVADSSSPARVLGDVIPISRLRIVISFGDVVLALGVAVIAAGEDSSASAGRRVDWQKKLRPNSVSGSETESVGVR